jgi:hypothetical protein
MTCYQPTKVLCTLALAALAWPAAPVHGQDRQEAAAGANLLRGKIVEVRSDSHLVLLRTRGGKEWRLYLDDHASLQRDGQPAQLSDFRPGMRVRVAYRAEDGKNRLVSMTDAPITRAVARGAREALRTGRSYGYERRVEYHRQLEAALADLDHRIDDLEEGVRGRSAAPEARARFGEEIKELRRKRDVVSDRLTRLKTAGPEAWESLKAGAANALDDLQGALDRARSRLRGR